MPQMSPMYWMILMFLFIVLLILMIMYMYFTINVIPKYFVTKLNVNKMNWMW